MENERGVCGENTNDDRCEAVLMVMEAVVAVDCCKIEWAWRLDLPVGVRNGGCVALCRRGSEAGW
jgi:hypothetical protein